MDLVERHRFVPISAHPNRSPHTPSQNHHHHQKSWLLHRRRPHPVVQSLDRPCKSGIREAARAATTNGSFMAAAAKANVTAPLRSSTKRPPLPCKTRSSARRDSPRSGASKQPLDWTVPAPPPTTAAVRRRSGAAGGSTMCFPPRYGRSVGRSFVRVLLCLLPSVALLLCLEPDEDPSHGTSFYPLSLSLFGSFLSVFLARSLELCIVPSIHTYLLYIYIHIHIYIYT